MRKNQYTAEVESNENILIIRCKNGKTLIYNKVTKIWTSTFLSARIIEGGKV